jgi:MFS family permease
VFSKQTDVSRPDPIVSGLGGWFMVAVIVLLVLLSYIDRAILSLFGDLVKRDLGLSDQQLGLLFGLGFIAPLALVTLVVGWAVDRYNRVTILLIGLVTWSAMTAFCGLVSGFSGLLIARGGVGAGEAVVGPAGYAMVGDRFPPEKRGRAIGAIAAAVSVGTGLALILGGLLLDLIGPMDRHLPYLGTLRNWQFCFVLLGCAAIPLVPLVLLLKDDRSNAAQSDTSSNEQILPYLKVHRRIFTAIIGCGIVNVAAGTGAVAWTALFLARHFQMTPADAGILLGSMSMIGGLLGAPIAAELSDRFLRNKSRWGRLQAHPWLFLILAGGASLIAFSTSLYVAAAGFLLVATMLAAINAVSYAAIQDVSPPAIRGRMISLLQFATLSVGYGLGPSLVAMTSSMFEGSTRALGYGLVCSAVPLGLAGIALSWLARDSYFLREPAVTALEES